MAFKIIKNSIGSVGVDTEEANFPGTNVETEYQAEKWKATSSTGTLTLTVNEYTPTPTSTGALFIGGTNAIKATITITGVDTATVYVNAEVLELGEITEISTTVTLTENTVYEDGWFLSGSGSFDADTFSWEVVDNNPLIPFFWYEIQRIEEAYTVEIELLSDSGSLEVGVARCGGYDEYRSPQTGLVESELDTSIRKSLASGAEYIKQREVLKVVSGTIDVNVDDLNDIKARFNVGLFNGIACNFYDTTSDGLTRGIIYGNLRQTTKITMSNINLGRLGFTFTESL